MPSLTTPTISAESLSFVSFQFLVCKFQILLQTLLCLDYPLFSFSLGVFGFSGTY